LYRFFSSKKIYLFDGFFFKKAFIPFMPIKILGDELPEDAYNLLQKGITTAVISTVDQDGYPRSAPFGWITAKDKTTLRVGMSPNHRTFENISRDGKVMVCIMDEGNIGLGIKGDAKVIKKNMKTSSWEVSVVEINLIEVKSDAMETSPITQGVRWYSTPEEHKIDLKVLEQLRSINPDN
jgi:hypothetical protein